MSKLVIGNGQTIADLSLQLFGETGHEIEIIQANGLEESFEDIKPPLTLNDPEVELNEVLAFYQRNNIKPTSRFPEDPTFGGYSEGYSNGYE